MTKFVSWNVNGLRAAIRHGFLQVFNDLDADFFCVQETKLAPGQLDLELPGYHQYWNYAEKKGYSGTAVFARQAPINVTYGINVPEFDHEGRVITLEYPDFYLINTYVPNSGAELKRLDFRRGFNSAFYKYVNQLSQQKSIVWCGDLNVAHQEIDLKNPQSNHHHPGFTDEERLDFSRLLKSGFTDTFRFFYPDQEHCYSWWSYRFHARQRNAGWRIDYFVASADLDSYLMDAKIHNDVLGSDHCPVELDVQLPKR